MKLLFRVDAIALPQETSLFLWEEKEATMVVALDLNKMLSTSKEMEDSEAVIEQAEDGIRDVAVTGVQTCDLPISIDDVTTRLMICHYRAVISLPIRRNVTTLTTNST